MQAEIPCPAFVVPDKIREPEKTPFFSLRWEEVMDCGDHYLPLQADMCFWF
jgi:hypothetical protein